MRRAIRKRIRRHEDGLDLALDLNADVVVNLGHSGAGHHPEAAHADRVWDDSDAVNDKPHEREDA